MSKYILFIILFVSSFTVGCQKNQYLTGTFTRDEFFQECYWQNHINHKYKPDLKYLDSLKQLKNKYDVIIFVGSWCSDSRKWVPKFFKIQPNLPVNSLKIIAVDTSKKDPDNLYKFYGVDSVPTFLFLKPDKQIKGRLNVKPQKESLEKALYRALR